MSQQVKLISIIKALPGQTREQFKKRWLEGHAPIPASWKNLKSYRINIPVDEYHAKKGEGILFDGTAELIWDSFEEMQEDMNSEVGKKGFKDGDEFIGFCVNLYCEEFIAKNKE